MFKRFKLRRAPISVQAQAVLNEMNLDNWTRCKASAGRDGKCCVMGHVSRVLYGRDGYAAENSRLIKALDDQALEYGRMSITAINDEHYGYSAVRKLLNNIAKEVA